MGESAGKMEGIAPADLSDPEVVSAISKGERSHEAPADALEKLEEIFSADLKTMLTYSTYIKQKTFIRGRNS